MTTILRPSSDFSVNGALRGGIIAEDEQGEPLWESRGNWSDRRFLNGQAKDLANSLGKTEDWARAMLTEAVAKARKASNSIEAARQAEISILPRVSVTGRHLRDISNDGWDLLAAQDDTDHRLYVLGDAVVDLRRGALGQLTSKILGVERLRWHLARLGDWQRASPTGQLPVAPPKLVLEDMLAEPDPPLPKLTGIAESPIVTSDGEILTRNGYHAGSGYYLDLGKLDVPPVSPRPSQDDLANARRLLLEELLVDFPFVTESDRTHAVEGLLAPIVRPLVLGPTPLRMVEGSTPGSGKGKYVEVVSLITTGRPPRSTAEKHSDEEWRKGITSVLTEARTIVLIDNVARRLESGVLAKVLTDQVWSDRALGSSRQVTIPVQTCWYATGNNPRYSDEIADRMLRIRIVPNVERARERTGFRHPELIRWVREERARLLWALLTFVSAWLAAGRPRGQYVWGSYEEYTAITGGILDTAGLPGFLGTREETYRHGQERLRPWQEFVEVWWQEYHGQVVGVGKLLELARTRELLVEIRSGRKDHAARIAMGIELKTLADRIVNGFRLRCLGEGRTGSAEYQLEQSLPKETPGPAETPRDPAHPAKSRDPRGVAESLRAPEYRP